MILAAGLYASGQGPKPRELALYERFKFWGALPRGGGQLDQPYNLLDAMQTAVNVYSAVKAYTEHWTEEGWLTNNPGVVETMTLYWKVRDGTE